jgi:hypothetical protein
VISGITSRDHFIGLGMSITLSFRWKEFEGHESRQPRIFSLVNDAVSASAELFDNAIPRVRLVSRGCTRVLHFDVS